MSLVKLNLSLAGLAVLLLGCPPSEGDDTGGKDTEPEDTDTDDEEEEEEEVDSAYFLFGYAGEAAVAPTGPAPNYDGSEMIYLWGIPNGADICTFQYDVDSTGVRDDCAECTWAFDVVTSNTTMPEGPYCDYFFEGFEPSYYDDYAFAQGFAPEAVGYYGDTYTDVLMFYFQAYAGDPGGWSPASYYATATWKAGGAGKPGQFAYDWPTGYGYYYPGVYTYE
jgi:hypothetical protein